MVIGLQSKSFRTHRRIGWIFGVLFHRQGLIAIATAVKAIVMGLAPPQ
jgi:hypothetical protein